MGCWQKCNIRNNGQKGGGQEIRERDCGLTPEVITLDRLGLMLAHHDRCHSKLLTADYLLLLLIKHGMCTVLRTVLTDFKNKHDLDICDLRNVQNFAKII